MQKFRPDPRSFTELNQKSAKIHYYFRFCKSISGLTTMIFITNFSNNSKLRIISGHFGDF